jgi:hypothetical protein
MTSIPAPSECLYCGDPLADPKFVGRPRKYCSDRHRFADRRRRQATADPGLATQEFAASVNCAIEDSGHAARWLATQVTRAGQALSAPSLSEWRAGKSIPYLTDVTRDTVLSLERFVPTPPGDLLGALERTAAARGKHGWQEPRQPRANGHPSGPAASKAKLESEGFSNRGRTALVEARHTLSVGPDRRPGRCRSSCRLVALRPGVRRYVTVMTVDHRNPIELVPGEHCRLGDQREIRRGRYSVLAVEWRLDHDLDAYEPYELNFSTEHLPVRPGLRLPMPGWVRVVEDPACRLLELRLTFTGERPKEVWQGRWQQGPGRIPKPATEQPLTSADGTFELTLANPPLGLWGFRWRWPGAMEAGLPAQVTAR